MMSVCLAVARTCGAVFGASSRASSLSSSRPDTVARTQYSLGVYFLDRQQKAETASDILGGAEMTHLKHGTHTRVSLSLENL